MGDMDPINIWFLGPTRVHTPNDMSIGSDVFCRAHDRDKQIERPTDRPRYSTPSATTGHIYVVL